SVRPTVPSGAATWQTSLACSADWFAATRRPPKMATQRERNGAPAATPPSNGTADRPPLQPSANGAAPVNGRDGHGRFAPGNQAAAGRANHFARQVAALRQTLVNAVTADDVRAVAAKLLDQAKAGDVASARLLFAYTVGQPEPVRDPDRQDLD